VMFWTIFKKRVFVLYMVICLAGTVLITYSIQALFFVPGIDTGNALLKGVGSLSGGNAAIIRKSGENVRIVMDPAEKPLVATYTNILGEEGGVVFDAGLARFTVGSVAADDNIRYIKNIANWLELNSSSEAKGSILLYDLSDNLEKPLVPALKGSRLSERDFSYANRKTAPAIAANLLNKQSQVWLIFGKGSTLTDRELKEILAFSQKGGALLLVSGDNADLAGINTVSANFGVNFYGSADTGDKIPVAVAAPMFYRAAELIGKLLKLTNKA